MEPLTNRQQEILDFIEEMVEARGYPPSVREIGDRVGLRSPSTVHSHLSTLVNTGYIRRDPSKPRALEIVTRPPVREHDRAVRNVPLVGRIAAGVPILAEEDIEATYPLPTEITGPDPVFMLTVHGDSMKDVGILDGDFVVVRSQPNARDGDIVAALIDDEEATVKRFRRSGNKIVLAPENPDFEPMTFSDGVRILGKVVAVFRSL